MYDNPKLIAANLLKRYFMVDLTVNLEDELLAIQTIIEREGDQILKNFLNKLILVYQEKAIDDGDLSQEKISSFFLELSLSSYFKEHFNALWEDLFKNLNPLERDILMDTIPHCPPRYAPVKLATGRTYSYHLIAQYWQDKKRFTDPIDRTEVTSILVPDTDIQLSMRRWYEARGLERVWETRAINEGSLSWQLIERYYRGGVAFSPPHELARWMQARQSRHVGSFLPQQQVAPVVINSRISREQMLAILQAEIRKLIHCDRAIVSGCWLSLPVWGPLWILSTFLDACGESSIACTPNPVPCLCGPSSKAIEILEDQKIRFQNAEDREAVNNLIAQIYSSRNIAFKKIKEVMHELEQEIIAAEEAQPILAAQSPVP